MSSVIYSILFGLSCVFVEYFINRIMNSEHCIIYYIRAALKMAVVMFFFKLIGFI